MSDSPSDVVSVEPVCSSMLKVALKKTSYSGGDDQLTDTQQTHNTAQQHFLSALILISSLVEDDDDVTAPSSSDQDTRLLPSSSGSDGDAGFPTLAGVADIIATNIPSLAGVAASIGASSSASSAPGATRHIVPGLADATSGAANSNTPAVSLDSIFTSLATIPSLTGIVSDMANPADGSFPSAPPLSAGKPCNTHTGKSINQSINHQARSGYDFSLLCLCVQMSLHCLSW